MDPQHSDALMQFVGSIPTSFAGVKLLEFLEHHPKFGLLTSETSRRAKTVWGGVVAFITAIGVDGAVNYTDTGELTITITGLTMAAILSSSADFLNQWMMQQAGYTYLKGVRALESIARRLGETPEPDRRIIP